MVRTLEQAAIAVDEMFNSAYQAPGTLIEFLSLFYSIQIHVQQVIAAMTARMRVKEGMSRNEVKRTQKS